MARDTTAVKRPTSTDVAREAGLSRATVSYVLNNDPRQKIPEPTRDRVFAAAAKLGYTPSAAARALRSGRSDLVLCPLPDWPIGVQVGALLEELAAGLEKHDLTLLLHPRVHSARPLSAIWKSITPAAVLLFEDVPDQELRAMRATGAAVTTVVLNTRTKMPRGLYSFAEEGIGRLQIEHLAATGHRNVGYAYPDDPRVEVFARPRLDGVRMACADLELDEPDVQTVPLDPAGAEDAVRAWQQAKPRITAVCAYNDEVAMALLSAANRLGVQVPGDLAVIGVDDIPSAPLTVPALTTVHRNLAPYVDLIAGAVVRAIDGRPPIRRWPHSDTLTLVRRESA